MEIKSMTELDKIIHNQKRENYKNTQLSLYDRFWAQEKESEKFLNAVISAHKEPDKKARDEQFNLLTDNGKSTINLHKQAIDHLIDRFTKKDFTDEQIDDAIERYNKTGVFSNGRRADREALIFELDDKKVVVRTLSKAIPALLNYFPELETNARTCKCHEGSLNTSYILKDLEGMKVSTGSYYIVSPKSMVLHSVAEAFIEDKPFVIDYESNTLWEKDDFYNFYNFEPFESIPRATIDNDMDNLLYLVNIDKDYTKLYLTSRDEAIALSKKMQNENESK